MTIQQVFDGFSDGVLIVNQDGNINYFNQPASKVISGETIDTAGLVTLQRMMRLILNGELSTPVKFIEKSIQGTEYSVKILPLYSFYVVQFFAITHPSDYQQLKSNAIRMVNDKLGKKLELLTDELEKLQAYFRVHQDAAPTSLINNTINLTQNLFMSISELEQLAELYLKRPIDSYSTVAPVKLLRASLTQVEANCIKKAIRVKIKKKRSSRAKLYCNAAWMKMAVTECLLRLIDESEYNTLILLKMDLHGHFLSIIIERATKQSFQSEQMNDVTWIDHPMTNSRNSQYSHNTVNFDLLLAERVVSLHGGTLKLNNTEYGSSFIIEVPVGYDPSLDMTNTEDQLKIYAEELAKLQARQFRLKAV